MRNVIITGLVVLILGSTTTGSSAQGYVQFSNNPLRPVTIVCNGGLPATPADDLTVGLYWSYDVNGDYRLATTPSGESALAPIVAAGVFNNGGLPVGIVGTNPGDEVFIVIKAWSGGYSSVEEAWALGRYPPDIIGESAPTSAIRLAATGAPPAKLDHLWWVAWFFSGAFDLHPRTKCYHARLVGLLGQFGIAEEISAPPPVFY